ncbi:MAG: hypothetical protein OXH92_11920 [Bryobacterales bacterium]|nr:hypothetical protein [bacterium]MDE0434701.1 hypothetical protein [Bryobacterales bacterium]
MQDQIITIIVSIGGVILTSTIAIVGLILVQTRAIRSELRDIRLELREAARERAEIRDRLGRVEGYLDLLRQFFLGDGRGTAA